MGPLTGVKCLEIGGIGPGPFCGMMLSDLGAEVIRIERNGFKYPIELKYDTMFRGRRAIIGIDLKKPHGVQTVLKLIEKADVIFEGFRPKVMEKIGLGPEVCLQRNPKLVYGRVTGWGQEGPLAMVAGHDINYIALTGALHAIGRENEKPIPPLNLIGDYAGGGMLLAFGIVSALLNASRTGVGQVVDAAMVDGIALLLATTFGLTAGGYWQDCRGKNLMDGGAHFYDTYETADGKYIAIGSMEPKFYKLLLKLTGITDPKFKFRMDRSKWPELKAQIEDLFRTKTRDEWCDILEGTDVCFTPVLNLAEAPQHPHIKARQTFVELAGVLQPGPAPRFSRTRAKTHEAPPIDHHYNDAALRQWGLKQAEINQLRDLSVLEEPSDPGSSAK